MANLEHLEKFRLSLEAFPERKHQLDGAASLAHGLLDLDPLALGGDGEIYAPPAFECSHDDQ